MQPILWDLYVFFFPICCCYFFQREYGPLADEKNASKDNDSESTETEIQSTFLPLFQSAHSINYILNLIGAIGTVWSMVQFVVTLSQLRSGNVDAGLHFQGLIVVIFFIIFVALSGFKLSKDKAFVVFMASCYSLVFSLILIATFLVSTQVVLKYGFDLALAEQNSNQDDLEQGLSLIEMIGSSHTALALTMFAFALLGAKFFLMRSHVVVSHIATIPIFIFFLWILNHLTFQGVLLSEFSSGISSERVFGYFCVVVMTFLMVLYTSSALRRSG